MILSFCLLICLQIENNTQFSFYTNTIVYCKLVATNKQYISVEYNFFYIFKKKKKNSNKISIKSSAVQIDLTEIYSIILKNRSTITRIVL